MSGRSNLADEPTLADEPPSQNCQSAEWTYTFQCYQWEPIRNSQLIRKYKEIPVHRENRWTPPSFKKCQKAESTLHCSMLSMRAHLVKNGNFTLLLTSSGQEWQFHMSTDIWWSRMAISYFYWHLVVKNGNFTFLLTSSG